MKKLIFSMLFVLTISLTACAEPAIFDVQEIPDTTLTIITLDSEANVGLVIRANGTVDSIIDLNDKGQETIASLTIRSGELEAVLDELLPKLALNSMREITVTGESDNPALTEFFANRVTTYIESFRTEEAPIIVSRTPQSTSSSIVDLLEERTSQGAISDSLVITPETPFTEPESQTSSDLQSKLEDSLASSFILNAPEIGDEPGRVRVILVFRRNIDDALIERTQGNVLRRFQNVPAVTLSVPPQAIRGLINNPNVERLEYDSKVNVAGVVEWDLETIQAPQMWSNGYSGQGIRIGVIDTGIANHPDLRIAGGASFVSYTTSFSDDNGHGTHVAGIIGALKNNSGVIGVAHGADLYAIKVLDANGAGYLSDVVAGIDYAIQQNLDIINLSLGTTTDSLTLKSIIDKAYQRGIVVVAAAGNSGTNDTSLDTILFPARYSSAIAVGAIDSRLNRASFSSTGPQLELVAPGVSILSTHLGGQNVRLSGTSMAAPFVSGYIALMMQAFPTMNAVELRSLLIENARDLGAAGFDSVFGHGLIQAFDSPDITPDLEPEPTPSEPEVTEPSTPSDPDDDSSSDIDSEPGNQDPVDEPADEPSDETDQEEAPSAPSRPTPPTPPVTPPTPPQSNRPTAPSTNNGNFQGRLGTSVSLNKTAFRSDEVVEIRINVEDENKIGISNANVKLTLTPPLAGRIRPFTIDLTTDVSGKVTYRFTLPFNPNLGTYQVTVDVDFEGQTDQAGITFNAQR